MAKPRDPNRGKIHIPSVYDGANLTEGLIEDALDDIETIWMRLDHSDGIATRKALEQVLTDIINTYGSVVATQAAERFEMVRDLSKVGGRYTAIVAGAQEAEKVNAKLRAEIAPLFLGDKADPDMAFRNIRKLTDGLIKDHARQTVEVNVKRKGSRALGYARVPTGDWTCAHCLLYASRGAVYLSEQSAIWSKKGGKYHSLCNCQAEAVFSSEAEIEGYEPDKLYSFYEEAKLRSGSGDINQITEELKKLAASGEYEIS